MSDITFTRDEANARLTIERTFPAEPTRVWEALTDPALLDQWWAPKPWRNRTVRMDFRVGGHWLYAMRGPEGAEHFGRMDYVEINPERHYRAVDAFCDPEGNAIDSFPTQVFENTLEDLGNRTKLVTVVQYSSIDDMNRVFEMGFREGLTAAYEQLEALLTP